MVIVWMALIFIVSAQSQLPGPKDRLLDFLLEKTAHTAEYAILAFLWLNALRVNYVAEPRSLLLALLLTWAYALSDEFHQSFVPGRSAGWSDVAFDWLGAVAGLWAATYRRILDLASRHWRGGFRRG